jgi:hypothetical protein
LAGFGAALTAPAARLTVGRLAPLAVRFAADFGDFAVFFFGAGRAGRLADAVRFADRFAVLARDPAPARVVVRRAAVFPLRREPVARFLAIRGLTPCP